MASRQIPTPNLTVDHDGELCFEWWRGDEKRTLYAKPTTVLRTEANGHVDDTTVDEVLAWLRSGPTGGSDANR